MGKRKGISAAAFMATFSACGRGDLASTLQRSVPKTVECPGCDGYGQWCDECGDIPCSCSREIRHSPIWLNTPPVTCGRCKGSGRIVEAHPVSNPHVDALEADWQRDVKLEDGPCASVARLCQWCLNPVRDDQPHVSGWGNRYWHTQCWNSMRAVDNADEPEDLRTCHEIGAERCPPRE